MNLHENYTKWGIKRVVKLVFTSGRFEEFCKCARRSTSHGSTRTQQCTDQCTAPAVKYTLLSKGLWAIHSWWKIWATTRRFSRARSGNDSSSALRLKLGARTRSTVASRYRARGARCRRRGADSAARRVAERRATARRRGVALLRHGQLDALRHSLVCSSGGSTYMHAPRHLSRVLPRRRTAPRLRRLTSPRSTDTVAAPLSRRRRVLRSMTRARLFPGIRILTKKLKENISYVILYYAMGTFKNYVLYLNLRHICAFLMLSKNNLFICTYTTLLIFLVLT